MYYKYNTSAFNTVYFDRNPSVCSCQGGKVSNDFKSGAFTGRFKSDSAASMAVKGLITAGLNVHQQSVPVKERTHTHLKRADYIIILT